MIRFSLILLLAAGCTKPTASDAEVVLEGIGALGHNSNDVITLKKKIGDEDDDLDFPQDLDFNPERPNELWVVNKDDDSVTVFFDPGTANQTSEHFVDPFAMHFMEQVTSIEFGAPGTFGTCQDGRNTYNGSFAGNDFTGPTLWSSDFDVFAESNPEAVDYLTEQFGYFVDLGSHLDMLHESPECMGITWSHDNVYWVFDGFHESIARYDFQEDHGAGYDDHNDGIIGRYVEGEVRRKKDVVSHMALDQESGLLYIADSGHNRIAVMDTNTGDRGDDLPAMEPRTDHYLVEGAEIWTLVDGDEVGLGAPAGLALIDGMLFVTDNITSNIHAFDLEGNMLDWAYTGLSEGSLAGIDGDSASTLYFVDQSDDSLYQLVSP